MLYADGLGAVFAFGGIYAATVFGWGEPAARPVRHRPHHRRHGRLPCSAACSTTPEARNGSSSATLGLFIAAALGVLSVDRDHVLFVVPVAPKAEGSATFSSIGEKVYLAFAILIGIASGPIQSSSRTLLARMCPPDKVTEFFGFFSFSGKITAFAAPLAIGAVTARDRQPAPRHRLQPVLSRRRPAAIAPREGALSKARAETSRRDFSREGEGDGAPKDAKSNAALARGARFRASDAAYTNLEPDDPGLQDLYEVSAIGPPRFASAALASRPAGG